jgi:hypothetical protein
VNEELAWCSKVAVEARQDFAGRQPNNKSAVMWAEQLKMMYWQPRRSMHVDFD